MGLLDQLAGSVLGQSESNSSEGMLAVVMDLIKQHEGGLSGLIAAFQKGGLEDVVNSWISQGNNLPVSAEQIQAVLGSDQIGAIASRLGMDSSSAASGLAQFLPMIIDQLTPNGSVESSDSLATAGMDLLKGQLFG